MNAGVKMAYHRASAIELFLQSIWAHLSLNLDMETPEFAYCHEKAVEELSRLRKALKRKGEALNVFREE